MPFFSLYLNIFRLRKGPGKFFRGFQEKSAIFLVSKKAGTLGSCRWYLWYTLYSDGFPPDWASSASWDKDELTRDSGLKGYLIGLGHDTTMLCTCSYHLIRSCDFFFRLMYLSVSGLKFFHRQFLQSYTFSQPPFFEHIMIYFVLLTYTTVAAVL